MTDPDVEMVRTFLVQLDRDFLVYGKHGKHLFPEDAEAALSRISSRLEELEAFREQVMSSEPPPVTDAEQDTARLLDRIRDLEAEVERLAKARHWLAVWHGAMLLDRTHVCADAGDPCPLQKALDDTRPHAAGAQDVEAT